ncbi:MAG: hypothetical protein H7Y00_02895 [Fimbriimonadaceae bacterium]|nr:hypothetical protein [Chitinophagales bacterium]
MKTKLQLFCICILLTFTGLYAGDHEIQWGTMDKAGGTTNSYMPLGWIGGNYYAVQIDGKDGLLMNINGKMDIAAQTELITGEKKFDADVAYLRNGEINLLMSEYESGEKTNYVRAVTFNLAGKPTKTKLKKIAAVKVEKNTEKSDFQYKFSGDSSKILIVHEHDMKGDDEAKITLTVVNTENYEELWKTSASFPYEDKNFTLLSAAVENDGDVAMLALIKGEEGSKLEKYSTSIFSFIGTSGKFDEKNIKMEGKFISSARVKFVNSKRVLITGFYNDLTGKGKSEGIEGAFMAVADPANLEDFDMHIKVMDASTKAAISPSGAFAKFFNADELNAYTIQEMNEEKDGSGYVIAEQRRIIQDEEQSSVSRTYYFNHLIIFRYNSVQEIDWISTIPKMQSTTISTPKLGIGPLSVWYFPGYLTRAAYKYNSFVSTAKDGDIYILYNDHKDNGDARSLKDVKMMVNKNKALATLVTVGGGGDWEKEALFRGKDLDVILETSSCLPIVGTSFTISAERGKNLQYGKLNL